MPTGSVLWPSGATCVSRKRPFGKSAAARSDHGQRGHAAVIESAVPLGLSHGANEPSGVEAGEKDHDEQADREPDELANDDATARPPYVEARERHRADHNQPERGHQQQPVDVLQQAPVDPKH